MSSIFDGVKHNKQFEKLCKKTQMELKNYLKQKLDMVSGDGWLYKQGTFPVLLTAHMDTVHKEKCKTIIYKKDKVTGDDIITSPEGIGGDHRCGIYMILKILEKVNCSVLFCEDEEIGSVGARKFVDTNLFQELKGKFKYIIELDRAHENDAVFYHDDNQEFHDFIINGKEFWRQDHGSWSDICTLSPALGISSVNLSCGYYSAHSLAEYVNLDEMERSILEVIKVLERTDVNAEPFEYKETKYDYSNFSYLFNNKDDFYDYYGSTSNSYKQTYDVFDETYLEIILSNGDYITVMGADKEDCWQAAFLENPDIKFGDVVDFYFY